MSGNQSHKDLGIAQINSPLDTLSSTYALSNHSPSKQRFLNIILGFLLPAIWVPPKPVSGDLRHKIPGSKELFRITSDTQKLLSLERMTIGPIGLEMQSGSRNYVHLESATSDINACSVYLICFSLLWHKTLEVYSFSAAANGHVPFRLFGRAGASFILRKLRMQEA